MLYLSNAPLRWEWIMQCFEIHGSAAAPRERSRRAKNRITKIIIKSWEKEMGPQNAVLVLKYGLNLGVLGDSAPGPLTGAWPLDPICAGFSMKRFECKILVCTPRQQNIFLFPGIVTLERCYIETGLKSVFTIVFQWFWLVPYSNPSSWNRSVECPPDKNKLAGVLHEIDY